MKLGYGGTASEMVRLINDSQTLDHTIDNLDDVSFDQIIEAIHAIQTQMGVTGTTATEAEETIKGSAASMKAAWEDMLAAVGGEGDKKRLDETLENFKTSFSTYVEQFIPTLVTTISNSGTLVEGIADAIGNLPTDLLTQVAETGLDAGAGMIGGVSKILNWLIDSIVNMFDSASKDNSGVEKIANAIGQLLGTAISKIVTNAGTILTGIISVGEGLAKGLIDGLFQGLFGGEGAEGELKRVKDQLAEDIVDVNVDQTKASGLLDYIQRLAEKYGAAATEMDEFKEAKKRLEDVMPGAGEVFDRYGKDVNGAVEELKALQREMKATAIRAGMTKALNAEYELLGELQTKKASAEYEAESKRYQQESAQSKIAESLQEYAKTILSENGGYDREQLAAARSMMESGAIPWDETEIARLSAIEAANTLMENGTVRVGNEEKQLSELTQQEMGDLIDQLAGLIEPEEGQEAIWDKEYSDDIYDPETLKQFAKTSDTLTSEIEDSLKEANDAQKDIEEVNKEIAVTEGAIEKLAAEQNEGNREAIAALQKGGQDIGAAMTFISQKIYSLFGSAGDSGDGGADAAHHAKGLWDVPYDGYRAILHRDERVLTASQARRQDSGGGADPAQMYEIVSNAIRDGMNGVTVDSYLNSRRVTDDVNRNTTRAVKARRFAG